MDSSDLSGIHALLDETAAAVNQAVNAGASWGMTGTKDGQYEGDVVANEAALGVLLGGGVGVLSEETGLHDADREVVVVLDPVDGSTNASMGLPWYSVSLCAVADGQLIAARVENLVSGDAFFAEAGKRAYREQRGELGQPQPIQPSGKTDLSDALVAFSNYPQRRFGWKQYRSLGSSALDLCMVAAGVLDAFADVSLGELAPWDYLGGMFICQQAGAPVIDAGGAQLVTLDHEARLQPIAAATPELLDSLHREIQAAS